MSLKELLTYDVVPTRQGEPPIPDRQGEPPIPDRQVESRGFGATILENYYNTKWVADNFKTDKAYQLDVKVDFIAGTKLKPIDLKYDIFPSLFILQLTRGSMTMIMLKQKQPLLQWSPTCRLTSVREKLLEPIWLLRYSFTILIHPKSKHEDNAPCHLCNTLRVVWRCNASVTQ